MFPLLSYFLFALAAFAAYFFLSGFIWGAGYYPTSSNEIDSVIRLLKLDENSTFYDLGSGYGRMIIKVAQRTDAHSIGVEIESDKVLVDNATDQKKRTGQKSGSAAF